MSKITGTLTPLHDKVILCDMNFGGMVTAGGLFIPSTDAKRSGVIPRWGKVFAVGPEQKDVKVGEWVLMEHGRWSRTFEYENKDGSITELRLADLNGMMLASDQPITETMVSASADAGSNFKFNIPGAG
jgi:co-chaperonin GroES (HSP10)